MSQGRNSSIHQSFALEILLAFFLMFVIINVSVGAKERGVITGVAIGGMVALQALVGGPISGASMNPARSLGPAVVSGNLSGLAPFASAFLGILGCRWVQEKGCCTNLQEQEG